MSASLDPRKRAPVGPRRLAVVAAKLLLAIAVVTAAAILLVGMLRWHVALLFDFKGDLYRAGVAILHGHNPYHPEVLTAKAALKHAGGNPSPTFAVPVYPAPALLAFLPLSALPYWLACVVFTAVSIVAFVAALHVLGVRDWRCYAVALLCWPTMFGLRLGSLGPLLLLGAAIAWRCRDRVLIPAAAIAATIVAKLFPWPLAVWLVIRRQWRTLALSVAIGGIVTLAAWAVIGFDGMTEYPRMLSNLSFVEEGAGPSLVAVLMKMGVSESTAHAVALLLAGGLLLAAWRVSRATDGERRAFGLVVIAALTASPLVWTHYLVMLFIPIALLSPGLSWLWFVPLGTWFCPSPSPGSASQLAFYVVLEAIVAITLLWPGLRFSRPRVAVAAGSHGQSLAERTPPVVTAASGA
jgi:hypothetical protein